LDEFLLKGMREVICHPFMYVLPLLSANHFPFTQLTPLEIEKRSCKAIAPKSG
jgi:hypothetical protein